MVLDSTATPQRAGDLAARRTVAPAVHLQAVERYRQASPRLSMATTSVGPPAGSRTEEDAPSAHAQTKQAADPAVKGREVASAGGGVLIEGVADLSGDLRVHAPEVAESGPRPGQRGRSPSSR
jgi:hypothetical protein